MTLGFGQPNHSPDCEQETSPVNISTLNPGDKFAFPNNPKIIYKYVGLSDKIRAAARHKIEPILPNFPKHVDVRINKKQVIPKG